jgi:hypothetical protein
VIEGRPSRTENFAGGGTLVPVSAIEKKCDKSGIAQVLAGKPYSDHGLTMLKRLLTKAHGVLSVDGHDKGKQGQIQLRVDGDNARYLNWSAVELFPIVPKSHSCGPRSNPIAAI